MPSSRPCGRSAASVSRRRRGDGHSIHESRPHPRDGRAEGARHRGRHDRALRGRAHSPHPPVGSLRGPALLRPERLPHHQPAPGGSAAHGRGRRARPGRPQVPGGTHAEDLSRLLPHARPHRDAGRPGDPRALPVVLLLLLELPLRPRRDVEGTRLALLVAGRRGAVLSLLALGHPAQPAAPSGPARVRHDRHRSGLPPVRAAPALELPRPVRHGGARAGAGLRAPRRLLRGCGVSLVALLREAAQPSAEAPDVAAGSCVMSAPAVSVLMTAFNRERYVAEAIASVLGQTFEDFELVVVDDASHDRTVDIARKYEADPRVRVVVNERNLGDYPNRNRAAALARGAFIKFHDSDDVMYPHCLAAMVEPLRAEPGAALALSSGWHWPGGPCPMLLTPRLAYQREFLGQGLFMCGPAGALIRTDVFRALGGFPERGVASDYVFWVKAS